MCLIVLAWRAHPRFPLVVAANRDEYHGRPAAQAGFWGDQPSILAGRDLEVLPTYRQPLEKLLKQLFAAPIPKDTLLNINLPPIPGDSVKGVRVTSLGSRVYVGSLRKMQDPWGRDMFWIGGGEINWTGGGESDFGAIDAGYISITPLHLDLTSYQQIEAVRGWRLEP